MLDYPRLCVAVDGYGEEPHDGTILQRAEDGTPWVLHLFPDEQRTFTITHPAMTAAQQRYLEDFYWGARGDYVRFFNPRYQQSWKVLMVGAPRLSRMVSGMLADVQMTLTGEPE